MAENAEFAGALSLLTWFGLTEDDETHLTRVRSIFATRLEELVRRLYEHLFRLPEARAFLTDPERVAGLERTQSAYILSLGQFSWNEPASLVAYYRHRAQIGQVHRRIGLEPSLYMGAYSKLGELLIAATAAEGATDSLPSLHKILLFDSYLAVEACERQHRDELVATALVDELTGLPTRKAVIVELRAELTRALRFGRPLTLGFLDVDRFKQLNDRFGHAFGDRVLHDVAAALRASIRPMDIAGRYGGDEFVVGIVEATEAVARLVAERIRRRMATLAAPNVTLTIGFAALRAGDDLEALVKRADEAMYKAKSLGRGRIVVSSAASEASA